MPEKIRVFISSKMSELADERRIIKDALHEILVEGWVFEADAGAKPESSRKTYLKALKESDLYIGIFWKGYGEYTVEDEFVAATQEKIPRLIYERRQELEERDPKLQNFLDSISDVEEGLTIKWYSTPEELRNNVKHDVADWLKEQARARRIELIGNPSSKTTNNSYSRSFDVLIEDKIKNFVGRKFIFEAVGKFIKNQKAGYVLVRGEPGIGKTAFMAKFVNDHGYLHHFNIATQGINTPNQFLENIITQLISRYGLKYDRWPDNATSDSAFFTEVLSAAASNKESLPIIVAIDALDESDRTLLDPSQNILYLPYSLPEGVFIVVTSRPLDQHRLYVDSIKILDIEPDSERNVLEDISSYKENSTDWARHIPNLKILAHLAHSMLSQNDHDGYERLLKSVKELPNILDSLIGQFLIYLRKKDLPSAGLVLMNFFNHLQDAKSENKKWLPLFSELIREKSVSDAKIIYQWLSLSLSYAKTRGINEYWDFLKETVSVFKELGVVAEVWKLLVQVEVAARKI